MNEMLLLARYIRRKNKIGSEPVPNRQNPNRLARLFKRRNKERQEAKNDG